VPALSRLTMPSSRPPGWRLGGGLGLATGPTGSKSHTCFCHRRPEWRQGQQDAAACSGVLQNLRGLVMYWATVAAAPELSAFPSKMYTRTWGSPVEELRWKRSRRTASAAAARPALPPAPSDAVRDGGSGGTPMVGTFSNALREAAFITMQYSLQMSRPASALSR